MLATLKIAKDWKEPWVMKMISVYPWMEEKAMRLFKQTLGFEDAHVYIYIYKYYILIFNPTVAVLVSDKHFIQPIYIFTHI